MSVKAFETWHMRSILHFYHKVQIFSHISKYVSNEKVENYMLSQCHKYRDFFGIFSTCILHDVEMIRDTVLFNFHTFSD